MMAGRLRRAWSSRGLVRCAEQAPVGRGCRYRVGTSSWGSVALAGRLRRAWSSRGLVRCAEQAPAGRVPETGT